MDRRAIATARRHRLVAAELDGEREREARLADQLEEVVTELDGPAIDTLVLARLAPDDAVVVREVVQGGTAIDLGIEEDFLGEIDEDEPYDPTADLEDEIVRLQGAIEESRKRQRALQAYLDALDALT